MERYIRESPDGPGDNPHVIDERVAEDHVQHNPHAGHGRDGSSCATSSRLPLTGELGSEGTIAVTLIAEGDLVVRQEVWVNGMLIDIFRVEGGQLAEHWNAWRSAPGIDPLPGL